MTHGSVLQLAQDIRAAIERAGLQLPVALQLLMGAAARFAVAAHMPLDAFVLHARDAYDVQRREYEAHKAGKVS